MGSTKLHVKKCNGNYYREPLKTSLLDFQLKIKRLEPDAIEVKNIKKMLNSHFLNIFRISKKNQA
ncbi:hypothetical protein [Leptospira noguchii]|uniref:hypothetical protein n=1 Tax=Leptospira noguchii TaxID=28182 RepID=UPI00056A6C96|nr:hypothetical protein [Leptospira noguchii]